MTKNEIQALIDESRMISARMLNAIREYLAEHKSAFLETNLAENDCGEIVLNGIEPDELDSYLWMDICVSPSYEVWKKVMVIGIEHSNSKYSGGAEVYYLYPDENEIHTAYLSDVSTDDYENVLTLLASGSPFNTNEIPSLEEETD